MQLTSSGVAAARRSRVALALKRLIDLSLAVGCLVVLLPLLGLIAVLIRLDSPGGVLFRQQRDSRR